MSTKPSSAAAEIISQCILDLVRAAIKQIEAERPAEQAAGGSGPALMRPKEAYEYVAAGKTKFYQLVKAGVLTPVRTDFGPRYRREDLDRYIKECSPQKKLKVAA